MLKILQDDKQIVVTFFQEEKASHTRGQKCLFKSKICHHNENPSVTQFTKGKNLVAARKNSKMLSITSGRCFHNNVNLKVYV